MCIRDSYDIDVVISRSVAYLGLGAVITLLYAAVVAGPLPPAATQAIEALVRGVDCVDRRRSLYERLDLLRFAGGETLDWSPLAQLLERPATRSEDQLAFAGIWASLDGSDDAVELVADDLVNDRIRSPYARALSLIHI